jgi:hypothetical protein
LNVLRVPVKRGKSVKLQKHHVFLPHLMLARGLSVCAGTFMLPGWVLAVPVEEWYQSATQASIWDAGENLFNFLLRGEDGEPPG